MVIFLKKEENEKKSFITEDRVLWEYETRMFFFLEKTLIP
jgi:hypothetical protein